MNIKASHDDVETARPLAVVKVHFLGRRVGPSLELGDNFHGTSTTEDSRGNTF